ncbi:carboxymuconolactone decarboxylase family protein [Alcaligenaceae bacterium]|nr:carboxymuconolactone decarboxylase family protein [Alcaligenaceae bacterium]
MARMTLSSSDQLTPEQQAVFDMTASGLRGKVPTPMIAWLHNPELAYCARHWTSHHEWTAHKALALKAGLDPEIIQCIASHRLPNFRQDNESLIYEISMSLLTIQRLPSSLYTLAVSSLGEKTVVELVAVLGYYCMVSLTLNAFELGLPDNIASELDDAGVSV